MPFDSSYASSSEAFVKRIMTGCIVAKQSCVSSIDQLTTWSTTACHLFRITRKRVAIRYHRVATVADDEESRLKHVGRNVKARSLPRRSVDYMVEDPSTALLVDGESVG
jgi:hypothetical protein